MVAPSAESRDHVLTDRRPDRIVILEVLVFMEGAKPDNSEKNSRSKERTNNKLNPLETTSTGIEPG